MKCCFFCHIFMVKWGTVEKVWGTAGVDDVSKKLRAFLDYVAGKKTEDSFVERLEDAVKRARKNRE